MFEVDTFGKLKDISRFDNAFFNFSSDEANQCAPDIRLVEGNVTVRNVEGNVITNNIRVILLGS